MSLSKNGQELLIHIPLKITRSFFSVKNSKDRFDLSRLTRKERGVFDLAVKGEVAKEISAKLNVSMSTVKFHLSSIYKKFQVDGIRSLLRQAAI